MNLIIAALIGIIVIVLLISVVKLHPFLALMLGSFVMAVSAGISYDKSFTSFTDGLGSTVSSVGILIALGGIIGTLLTVSGGADVIVDTILSKTPSHLLPWAMALIAFAVGIPLFFEVGVVILIPVVIFAAHRANKPVILLGIPALAGLSTLHAFLPPHPGPLAAISALHANLGLTLGLGLLVAIPTVIISGPLLAKVMVKWVPIMAPDDTKVKETAESQSSKPSFGAALSVILLPVVLMLAGSIIDLTGQTGNPVGRFFVFVGQPLEALLITTLVAMVVLGTMHGAGRDKLNSIVGTSIGSVSGILLIVGAGGGFKQTLVDSGIGDVIAQGISSSSLNPLIAGWLVAVLIRVATGSATVATVTASGIMVPLASGLSPTHLCLLVLAIGAGSVIFSHLNDAGFWMVKEYFGMSVGQTFKTWTLMETVLSVIGLIFTLLLSLVV
jgi:GntP family gluconate:H+ symporter